MKDFYKVVRFILFLAVTVLGFSVFCFADSPITSTDFYEAYDDVEMVSKAKMSGVLTDEIAEFLASAVKPVDEKAAVVNALSWKFEGKDNAQRFQKFLMKKYKKMKKASSWIF